MLLGHDEMGFRTSSCHTEASNRRTARQHAAQTSRKNMHLYFRESGAGHENPMQRVHTCPTGKWITDVFQFSSRHFGRAVPSRVVSGKNFALIHAFPNPLNMYCQSDALASSLALSFSHKDTHALRINRIAHLVGDFCRDVFLHQSSNESSQICEPFSSHRPEE